MSYEKCVDFGKAHRGKSYQDMTKDPRYLAWFAEPYRGSRKPHHARFLRFIELHVEKLEAEKGRKTTSAPATQREAKAKPKVLQVNLPRIRGTTRRKRWEPAPRLNGLPSPRKTKPR